MDTDPGGRLQKVLAQAGAGSRRACEEMIAQGRVEVDGSTVTTLGTRVDPATAVIRVDGKRVATRPGLLVLAMNKPLGVVTTMSDEHGRPCVGDLIKGRTERLFHVGRLDADTSGLLLLTNDGELAHRLAHPAHAVPKTYVAAVSGTLTRQTVRQLRQGVTLDDGPAVCDGVRVRQQLPGRTLVEIVIHEGRNRIVRRIFEAVGHPVIELSRTQVGPVRLADLRPGAVRLIQDAELADLYAAVGM
ncbi:MAG: pseudouridine synthase [Actinomycetales bacterium]